MVTINKAINYFLETLSNSLLFFKLISFNKSIDPYLPLLKDL